MTTDFDVGRKWGLKICGELGIDGHDVAFLCEVAEFIRRWIDRSCAQRARAWRQITFAQFEKSEKTRSKSDAIYFKNQSGSQAHHCMA